MTIVITPEFIAYIVVGLLIVGGITATLLGIERLMDSAPRWLKAFLLFLLIFTGVWWWLGLPWGDYPMAAVYVIGGFYALVFGIALPVNGVIWLWQRYRRKPRHPKANATR